MTSHGQADTIMEFGCDDLRFKSSRPDQRPQLEAVFLPRLPSRKSKYTVIPAEK